MKSIRIFRATTASFFASAVALSAFGQAITDTGSRVGINTTTPTDVLELRNQGNVRIMLRPDYGANDRESLVDFWSTFDNYPADYGTRRTASVRAGFGGGTWGTEFLSLGVGGAGDSALDPLERLRISKDYLRFFRYSAGQQYEALRVYSGNGGTMKIGAAEGWWDANYTLQVGGLQELVKDDADLYIRFLDPNNQSYALGYDQSDGTFKINPGSSAGENAGIALDSTGRVGIGTLPTTTEQLTVVSGSPVIARFYGGSGNNHAISVLNANTTLNLGIAANPATSGVSYLWSSSGKLMIGNDGNPGFFFDGMATGSGKLGIGTTTPSVPLSFGTSLNSRLLGLYDNPGNWYGLGIQSAQMRLQVGHTGARFSFFAGDTTEVMTVKGDGNVGIGTTNPTQKLAVNGAIRAKEVIVETNWSDYVFADDYRLAPLEQVEQHIRTHRHLPGIPSEAEVAEHGVSLGDMQSRLLAKVEELTLYLIELKEANQALAQRVHELETQQATP